MARNVGSIANGIKKITQIGCMGFTLRIKEKDQGVIRAIRGRLHRKAGESLKQGLIQIPPQKIHPSEKGNEPRNAHFLRLT